MGDFQIIPMETKSKAVTTLDRINRYLRVANEISMDNASYQTGYNTEMQRVSILARMEVRTTETYSPCQKKSESVINIMKIKANRRRFQRNIYKRVWDFGMVWEAEIYS